MRNLKLEEWEEKLDRLLDEIDEILEDRYGEEYLLHPARQKRGTTCSKSQDGLIEIECKFSLGLGSDLGEGYVIQPRFITLELIPKKVREEAKNIVLSEIRKRLKTFFPENELSVGFDGNLLKIYGDLDFTV